MIVSAHLMTLCREMRAAVEAHGGDLPECHPVVEQIRQLAGFDLDLVTFYMCGASDQKIASAMERPVMPDAEWRREYDAIEKKAARGLRITRSAVIIAIIAGIVLVLDWSGVLNLLAGGR